MNVILKNIDPVNATITVAIEKADYQPQVDKSINDLVKNTVIDGFRKGHAPKGRIQAMYGKSVLVDEVNKLVGNKLYGYIQENKLNVLGEPLPSETEQKPIDFDKQEDFEFVFDVAFAPEVNVKLSKSDKITCYNIAVSDDMVEKQINNFKANYGFYDKAETVEPKDMVKGILLESAGDLRVEESVLMPFYIKEKGEQKKFIGAKVDDVIIFNPYKGYEGNEAELAAFLKIKKEEIQAHQGDFTFTVTEITRYREAELGTELYDQIYEPGTVKTEDELKARVKETIAAQLAPEGDYKFLLDAKAALEEKAKDIQFPDAFLKRWLLANDKKRTKESVDADYPKILEDLKFQLIKDNLVKENDIKIEKDDVEAQAVAAARAQFAQYGMTNVPDQLLKNYVQEMLKKQETVQNLINRALEDKLVAVLKEQVTLKPKEVTIEEFEKLFETK
ncbi:trigger factor [Bacteroidia bacterium]|nr:trigger factor [Bacteroidia bacterium]